MHLSLFGWLKLTVLQWWSFKSVNYQIIPYFRNNCLMYMGKANIELFTTSMSTENREQKDSEKEAVTIPTESFNKATQLILIKIWAMNESSCLGLSTYLFLNIYKVTLHVDELAINDFETDEGMVSVQMDSKRSKTINCMCPCTIVRFIFMQFKLLSVKSLNITWSKPVYCENTYSSSVRKTQPTYFQACGLRKTREDI